MERDERGLASPEEPALVSSPGGVHPGATERTGGQQSAPAPGEVSFRVSKISIIYRYLSLALLTLVGGILLYILMPMMMTSRDYVFLAILALWALALLRYWVFLLDMPYRIVLTGGQPIAFVSLLRTRRIGAADIRAFNVSPVYSSFLRVLTSRRKKVSLINHITGLHQLIILVKQANPQMETKGC